MQHNASYTDEQKKNGQKEELKKLGRKKEGRE